MVNKNEKIFEPINYKMLLWLIPLVGLVISSVFWLGGDHVQVASSYLQLFYGVLITGGLWVGCTTIVTFLWKKYPWHQQPLKHLLIEIVLITGYTLGFSFGLYSISVRAGLILPIEDSLIGKVFTTLLITYFITTLHESVFFYRQWKFNFSKSIKLENQHLIAKYESLKIQMNPHYVFNSLNNLVSIVDDNPLAVEYINQMSSFLRYMLKSRSEELVTLREELDMLNKYIYLHKIRFGETFNVKIQIDETFNSYKLPPLTLQMLMENCIKHNIIAKNKHLNIKVQTDEDNILIENNRNPQKNVDSTGQGLSNIKGRYKYFTNKDIIVLETKGNFKVSLPLIKD